MNEDMMTEAERASKLAEPAANDTPTRGKGVFYVHTLGCQMNVHDSERIAGVLEADGYVPATEEQYLNHDIDLIVMNTCAVRENAAERMYGTIGLWAELKRERPNLQIAVGGCMAQLDREKIAKKAPWVDAVFGTKNIGSLPQLLDQARIEGHAQVKVQEELNYFPSQLPTDRASKVSSWVAISVGCNNTCTFCIVPTTRGKEHDRRPGDILAEIRQCVDEGAKEVTLLGQNVNSFGYGIGDRFAFSKLLRACGEIDGLERVRFTSPHPAAFTDDVIAAMAETPNVMHQLHFPLQSGSDRILRAMRRSYRSAKFLDILRKIREAMPDAQISTDIIVGFPGETEEDFQETLRVVEEARFASAFTFIYSPRPGTPAAEMEQVPHDVVQDRFERLVALQERITEENLKTFEGRDVEVMVTGASGKKDAATHRVTGREKTGVLVHVGVPEGEPIRIRKRGKPMPSATESKPETRKVVSIVGPTASGKTGLGIAIAKALEAKGEQAEIVNADAYQMYKGMDIGTAKASPEEQAEVRHHLIDIIEPDDAMSVARFQEIARAKIAELQARGVRPILVGGSGLYARAAIDDISFPGTDPEVRKRLEEREKVEGAGALFDELKTKDPEAAARMDPHNPRRTIRALEVIEVTGRPYSASLPHYRYVIPTVQIGLDLPREELDRRIDIRTKQMLENGFVEEVERIRPRLGITAGKALGYQQVVDYLDGLCDLNDTFMSIAQKTKRLARKQMGWFGRDPRIHWLQALNPALLGNAMAIIEHADAGDYDAIDAQADAYTQHHLGDIA